VPEEFPSNFVWGLHDIGAAAGVYKEDGSVNTKVTRDRVIAGIIPAWKRNGVWQSAHSVINQALTAPPLDPPPPVPPAVRPLAALPPAAPTPLGPPAPPTTATEIPSRASRANAIQHRRGG
jgi:hypothetical protein